MTNLNRRLKDNYRYGVRSDLLHIGTFHEAMGPVLAIAQCFCLMPVRGVLGRSPSELFFSWVLARTRYALCFILITFLDTLLSLNFVVSNSIDVRNIEPFIFHSSLLVAAFAFLRLARKWPDLMLKWANVERQMPNFRDWLMRERLAKRIHRVIFVLMVLSLTEHILSTISAIHFANYCPARKDPIESYFYTVVSHVFYVFPYTPWLAWLGKIENVLLTFCWSYMDMFVMTIGIGLSELLTRVSSSIDLRVRQPMPETFWTHKRLQYRLVIDLIADVDEAVSGIMLLSFANNLYFVCIQLLKSINKMPSVAHAVYFYFSLCFLISRSLAVLLFVSAVNDRARDPLRLFKLVPDSAYTPEVARFANEVKTDDVALTGFKFFNVTRKLVLTVAGTIITYELVLIQFHEDQKLWDCNSN